MKTVFAFFLIMLVTICYSQEPILKPFSNVNHKWGFKDEKGKIIIPPKYDYVGDFSEGLAWVNLNQKYGFIDKLGRTIIILQYDIARNFHDGVAMVGKVEKYGFIDKKGKEVVSIKYERAQDFSENLAAVKFNNKWGYIDKVGNEIIPFKYDDTYSGDINEYRFSGGLACVAIGGKCTDFGCSDSKWGYIDKAGREVISFKYSKAYTFYREMAIVVLNNKWGIIDKDEKIIIPLQYDMIRRDDSCNSFFEGLAVVMKKNKWGYIDKSGNEVIQLKYDDADKFSEGLAAINIGGKATEEGDYVYNGKWGFIDKTGKVVIPIIFDALEYDEPSYRFQGGKVKVKYKGRKFYINKQGVELK